MLYRISLRQEIEEYTNKLYLIVYDFSIYSIEVIKYINLIN